MFLLKWAFKNIRVNKKRSAKTIILLSIIIILLTSLLGLINGTNVQMYKSLVYNYGDLTVTANENKVNQNINEVDKYIESNYNGLIDKKLKSMYFDLTVIGDNGYADADCFGVEEDFLSFFNKVVAWKEPQSSLDRSVAYCSSTLAIKLNLKAGDYLTLQISTDEGMINTASVEIGGIFIGSPLIYSRSLIITLDDAKDLFINGEPNILNVYFDKNNQSEEDYNDMYYDLSKKYFKTHSVESYFLYPDSSNVYSLFLNIRLLLNIVFYLVCFVSVYILFFAIRNSVFLTFKKKKYETSTLLTYGMKTRDIVLLSMYETIYMFFISAVVSLLLVLIESIIIKSIKLTSNVLSDFISVLGGPNIIFSFDPVSLGILILFMFAIVVFSTYRGIIYYLKMEVRQVMTSV